MKIPTHNKFIRHMRTHKSRCNYSLVLRYARQVRRKCIYEWWTQAFDDSLRIATNAKWTEKRKFREKCFQIIHVWSLIRAKINSSRNGETHVIGTAIKWQFNFSPLIRAFTHIQQIKFRRFIFLRVGGLLYQHPAQEKRSTRNAGVQILILIQMSFDCHTFASSNLPNAFNRFPKSLRTQYKSCMGKWKFH